MIDKIEKKDQKILHMALLNAHATAESIGGPIGEQGYQVRRALSGMQKEGIISPYTLINQFALGWMKIGVFFSFLPVEGQNIPAIIQKLQDYPNIVSVIELFGPHQYFMSVNAKSVPDFEEFMATLYDDIPDLKIDEAVSIRRRLSLFKRKYLAPDLGDKTHLTYSYTSNAEKLDDLSISVLNYMITAGGLPNGPAIAEAVGVSNTTVQIMGTEPPPINESGSRVNLGILWTSLRRSRNGSEEIYDRADYRIFAAGRSDDRARMLVNPHY